MKASLLKKYSFFILGIIILLLAYQILSWTKNDEFVYPNLLNVFKQVGIIMTSADAYLRIFKALLRLIIIILASVALSIIMSMLYYKFASLTYLFNPIINIFKAAPFAIIAIYLFLSVGSESAPYIMCFFVVFPIILEGFMTSIDSVRKEIKDDLKLLDISIFEKFFKVVNTIIWY